GHRAALPVLKNLEVYSVLVLTRRPLRPGLTRVQASPSWVWLRLRFTITALGDHPRRSLVQGPPHRLSKGRGDAAFTRPRPVRPRWELPISAQHRRRAQT